VLLHRPDRFLHHLHARGKPSLLLDDELHGVVHLFFSHVRLKP
jgi:hypothetical protein